MICFVLNFKSVLRLLLPIIYFMVEIKFVLERISSVLLPRKNKAFFMIEALLQTKAIYRQNPDMHDASRKYCLF